MMLLSRLLTVFLLMAFCMEHCLLAERAVVFSGVSYGYIDNGFNSENITKSNHWVCVRSLSSSSWRIDISNYYQGNLTEHTVIGCDGTLVATVSTPIITGHTNLPDNAILESGFLPPEGSTEAHPLWAAFCAPSVVNYYHPKKLPPLDGFADAKTNTIRSTKFRFETRLSPDLNYYTSFEQWNDGVAWFHEEEKLTFLPQPPPFNKGYVAIRMRETLVNDNYAHHDFVYERQVPGPTINGGAVLQKRYGWRVVLERMASTNYNSFVPQPKGLTDVQDRRWADAPIPLWAMEYRQKPGLPHWMDTTDSGLVKMYEGILGKSTSAQIAQNGLKKLLIISALIGVSAILAYQFVRTGSQTKRAT